MSQRPQEHFRRGLPTDHGRVRRVLDYEAGEGTSGQQHPPSPPRIQRPWSRSRYPPTVDDIIATPRKHRGVLRGIRRRQKLPDKDIHDYFEGAETSDEEVRQVGGDPGWSSDDDISPAEDSGDEYVPPGSRGERESDLDYSGFSGFSGDDEEEEEEEGEHPSESDGESEGDGPEVPRGGRWRGRGRGRGRGRARGGARGGARGRARSPPSSGDEGWSEDPTPPRYAPTHCKTWPNSASSNQCLRFRPVVPHKGTAGIFCGRNQRLCQVLPSGTPHHLVSQVAQV